MFVRCAMVGVLFILGHTHKHIQSRKGNNLPHLFVSPPMGWIIPTDKVDKIRRQYGRWQEEDNETCRGNHMISLRNSSTQWPQVVVPRITSFVRCTLVDSWLCGKIIFKATIMTGDPHFSYPVSLSTGSSTLAKIHSPSWRNLVLEH